MKSDKTAALEAREKELIDEMVGLRMELQSSRSDDADIHVGDLVTETNRGKTSVFRVARVAFYSFGTISLDGHKQLKDGSFGVRSQYIGTKWEKMPIPPIPVEAGAQ